MLSNKYAGPLAVMNIGGPLLVSILEDDVAMVEVESIYHLSGWKVRNLNCVNPLTLEKKFEIVPRMTISFN
jgi:hypothetical protein